jgi:hypothetical protein
MVRERKRSKIQIPNSKILTEFRKTGLIVAARQYRKVAEDAL